MARTVITAQKMVRGAADLGGTLAAPVAGGGGYAIDQANGMVVTPKKGNKLFLVIYNSKAGNIVTTVRAGAYPPALASGQGDLVLAGQVTVTFSFLQLEPGRHNQKDGSVQIDWDAGATGVIWALEASA